MNEHLRDYLQFAIDVAKEAGNLTWEYFRKGVNADFKSDDSPVTIADRKAEELIRSRIEKQFPDHAIIGEEFGGEKSNDKSHCWYIDPIDGTKAFIRGVPLYGVLIGLEIEGRVEVGVVNFPAIDEIVWAASGTGTFLNGQRVHVIKTDQLDRCMVGCTDPYNFETTGQGVVWKRIQKATYYRTGWSDAYGHALVATGRLELMVDPIMNSWDCGPFPVILREAGGYFGDWSGNETIHCISALSTTRQLLLEVLKLMNNK